MNNDETRRIGKVIRDARRTFEGAPVDSFICLDGIEFITLGLTKLFKEIDPSFNEEEFLQIVGDRK